MSMIAQTQGSDTGLSTIVKIKRVKGANGKFVKEDKKKDESGKRSLPFTLPDKTTASVTVQPASVATDSKSKKIKKPKAQFKKDEMKLIDISRPIAIRKDKEDKGKRFKVVVTYEGKDGKVHTKPVKFGKANDYEYIDAVQMKSLPQEQVESILSKRKIKPSLLQQDASTIASANNKRLKIDKVMDPFHEQFYVSNLLNTPVKIPEDRAVDINDAHWDLIRSLKL